MSYVRSKNIYTYPDGDGGITMHTNLVVDQGRDHDPFRYVVRMEKDDFRTFVREVISRVSPAWVKPKMIDDAVDKFIEEQIIP